MSVAELPMSTHYYKRFRMEFDLTRGSIAVPELPEGFLWQPWKAGLEERHAWVKLRSFHEEVDSTVFECLGDYHGCLRLMRDIAQQPGFLTAATWLIANRVHDDYQLEDCGTIQAVAITEHLASIQNVGIAPEYRGQGLGRALVLRCLAGCRDAGLHRVGLEVTAGNVAAVELYRRVGFRVTRTMYRSVDAAPVTA
ncbi:MAG: N-acetyltransferase [Planctomycetaceae bacterium]|nr:N-acetyltransferase [Planctomycetaceae bacterium]